MHVPNLLTAIGEVAVHAIDGGRQHVVRCKVRMMVKVLRWRKRSVVEHSPVGRACQVGAL
jgi:hypothetical protein